MVRKSESKDRRGRVPLDSSGVVTGEICRYEDGDENISIEGIPIREPVRKAGFVIDRILRFPSYLLKPSNLVMGDIIGRAFEPLALPAVQVALFWVRELQRMEVALQNK